MDVNTIFTKTAKGITQVNQRTQSLSRELTKVLKGIDGKSNVAALSEKIDVPVPNLEKLLLELRKAGFAKVFEVRKEEPLSNFGGDDDFDFTKPNTLAASLRGSAATFGPSKYRNNALLEQVEHATAQPERSTPPLSSNQNSPHEAAALAAAEAEEAQLQAALAAARAKSQAEARARAEREAQIRARLEVETKARKEAELKAVAEARRVRLEAEKARLDLEARLAEEQARRQSMAEAKDRLSEEQAARVEAEQLALAEARAAAEAEAKALADARAKAEEEAKALVIARQRAEAAAVKQQQELESAQRDLRQQLKAEIEAKLRVEMEALLKSDIEESARAEVEAAIMQEAQEEARRMLEEQLAQERDMLARAEQEAKARAEVEAKRMLAEQERRLRAEMEARISQIAAEKERAEQEAKRMAESQLAAAAAAAAELSRKLKAEAEARTALANEMREKLAQEQEALHQAQAQLQIETQLRERSAKESQANLEAERAAREAAEHKAQMEARAREIASRAVADQVAEKKRIAEEAEARIAEERRAREQAEEKAYADERAEAEQRAAQVARLKELAEQAEAKRQAEADAPKAKVKKVKTQSHPMRWAVIGVVLLLVVAVAIIQLMPLGAVNARFEKAFSGWLNDDVSSAGLNLVLLPKPHVRVDSVSIGRNFDAKVQSGRLYTDVTKIFGDRFVLQSMELTGVTVSAEALPRLVTWAKPPSRGKQLEIDRIVLKDVKLSVKGVTIEPFNATLTLDREGMITRAEASALNAQWQLAARKLPPAKPAEDGSIPMQPDYEIDFRANGMTMPLGPKFVIASLTAKGGWTGDELNFPEIEGTVFEGAAKGNLKINMSAGTQFSSEFTLARSKLDQVFETFSRDVSVSGRMEGAFTAQGSAPTLAELVDSVKVQGSFSAKDGAIGNVDFVQAMRTPGSVGGQTKFSDLSGKMAAGPGQIKFESLKLTGGVLSANGGFTVSAGNISGSVSADLRSSVAQDRAVFGLSGTVARPSLKRGG